MKNIAKNITKPTAKITLLICALLSVTLTGCKSEQGPKAKVESQAEAPASVSTRFANLLEQYYQDGLKLNPLQATYEGDNRFNDLFVNYLDDDVKQQSREHYQRVAQTLAEFSDEQLSDSEQMSKAVLQWEIDLNLAALDFNSDMTPIDQMWSLNLSMGQLASGSSAQPFNTVEDYRNWLSRVDGYLNWLSSAKLKMQQGVETDWVLPKSLIKKILPQLKSMTNPNLEEHLFYQPANNLPENISEAEKQSIKADYADMVQNKVTPAYQTLVDYISTDYLAATRDSSGIANVPNGEEFYQHQIKLYTTTNMTADDIHQLGLSEVARISAEMETVKEQVGFEGDLKSFFNHVRENKDLMPFTEASQVLEFFDDVHTRMLPQVEKLFDLKPKTPFEVRRTEAFRENSASAEYNPGSLDGTRPGIFYTPIPDASRYNVYDSESLFLHEAIPGHHYQISLTQENQDLPKFRKTLWYSGYGEGWALYTESLGKELGLFTDPYQYFGMLGAEMHRAIRLVVDTGLHSKDWTREQAIQYSLDNEADSAESIEREIERYMANPGQALAYKIGQLKIRELRELAENQLGEKFDIAQFHNQVLETGCVPLALLEEKIKRWIRTQS